MRVKRKDWKSRSMMCALCGRKRVNTKTVAYAKRTYYPSDPRPVCREYVPLCKDCVARLGTGLIVSMVSLRSIGLPTRLKHSKRFALSSQEKSAGANTLGDSFRSINA